MFEILKENKIKYSILGIEYDVLILYKARKRNITYRFRDGYFLVTCPRLTSLHQIKKGLDKFGESLIKRSKKDNEEPIGSNYIYIFGVKCPLISPIKFYDGSEISFKDIDDLKKKLKKLLFKVTDQFTKEFEYKMGIKNHSEVRILNMKTRYGSNKYTLKRISYAFILVHYSLDIIKGVCAHEVTHNLVPNHSKKFYETLLFYYPNYYTFDRKLKKGIYQ